MLYPLCIPFLERLNTFGNILSAGGEEAAAFIHLFTTLTFGAVVLFPIRNGAHSHMVAGLWQEAKGDGKLFTSS